jgi:hypothetical protein
MPLQNRTIPVQIVYLVLVLTTLVAGLILISGARF